MSTDNQTQPSFDDKTFLANLTSQPGVYRMLNTQGDIIYVGKARNLKKRVSSYFTRSDVSIKTRAMVAQIANIEITVTNTETEALLLENNLIKKFKPQYNILLRDDKSYPYIYLDDRHPYPRLSFYRGSRKEKGRYFGPFPGAGAVRESLNLLQKLFRVRQCEDSFFRNRSRPCLQYQIKRCTAPCVGYIDEQSYAEDVRHAVMFLEGKNTEVIDELAKRMEQASEELDFERAATYRDQISALRTVQERQYVSGGHADIDVLAAVSEGGVGCVQVFFIRNGQNLGNKAYYPHQPEDTDPAELLSAFINQYYVNKSSVRAIPEEIIVNEEPSDGEVLAQVLSEQAGRRVSITARVRGERARWLEMAQNNARHSLSAQMATKASMLQRVEALQDALGLSSLPQRIECFDISHTMGEETVASCVVFDPNGPLKSDYRRFNIHDITPGDDYAAMRQALTRRYKRVKEGEGKLPELLLIDGGKGQLKQAVDVLEELQVNDVALVGVAKGPDRKPGYETLFLSGQSHPIILPPDSPALHLIQQVRDEAHRFAIHGHRVRRGKKRSQSTLEAIPGLGAKRRQTLLRQFGGLQGISRAGVDDLAQVKGISRQLAQKIYDTFHTEDG